MKTDPTPARDMRLEHEDQRAPRHRLRSLWLLIAVALTVGVVLVLGNGFGRDPSVVRSVLIGRPGPRLEGPTLSGGTLNLADYRGKVVLVNVWASWCAACREEQPLLNATQRQLGPSGLRLVGIDMSDTVADARAFLRHTGGTTYPSVFDPRGARAVGWGAFGVPETYLIDRSGIVRGKAVGVITQKWIQTKVIPLLQSAGAR